MSTSPEAGPGTAAAPAAPADAEGGAGLLVRLRGLRPSLSPAEDRVAECVLADPRAAAALTISELAVQAETSETTVLRFCKRLGLPGYPQLRLALAAESAQPRSRVVADTDIRAGDSVDDIIAKIAFADASAVEETAAQLDRGALESAADAIARARRVDIYGIGASATVGMDAQQKLHRIGVVAFSWNDPHICLTSAALLREGDVAIGISHSGTTRETIEAVEAARSRGATTVAVTNFPLSRLAQSCDIVLLTAARETALRSGATASRIAALTVVDCLYIAAAHRDLERATSAVAETRAAVRGHHVD
ncbi:MurR/RpiR family transcriptional regulator [Lapillicoccus jejuensis]|uniref:RpiR family transcriptional regulator n=1 Tax=Lapillicoccus jejuensis TaxID=402171 RepID=A0A542DY68_9MICO|nr:MurR/RpiR family transcriptional regulator [Lapillicoccus jejuensis]TQJ07996.1 RpiR family transcriptional regulator [Lapillicoccus jejuensis]